MTNLILARCLGSKPLHCVWTIQYIKWSAATCSGIWQLLQVSVCLQGWLFHWNRSVEDCEWYPDCCWWGQAHCATSTLYICCCRCSQPLDSIPPTSAFVRHEQLCIRLAEVFRVWLLPVCGCWWWEVRHCSLRVWCPTRFSARTVAVLTVCCSSEWLCCSPPC